jgi:hypothetical protein
VAADSTASRLRRPHSGLRRPAGGNGPARHQVALLVLAGLAGLLAALHPWLHPRLGLGLLRTIVRLLRPPQTTPVLALAAHAEASPQLAWLRGVRGLHGTFLLARSHNRVGRSSTGEVVLGLDTVSRHQCTIRHDGRGWLLVAAASRNGTFLNATLVPAEQASRLRDGDTLGIGEHVQLEIFIPEPGVSPASR